MKPGIWLEDEGRKSGTLEQWRHGKEYRKQALRMYLEDEGEDMLLEREDAVQDEGVVQDLLSSDSEEESSSSLSRNLPSDLQSPSELRLQARFWAAVEGHSFSDS